MFEFPSEHEEQEDETKPALEWAMMDLTTEGVENKYVYKSLKEEKLSWAS